MREIRYHNISSVCVFIVIVAMGVDGETEVAISTQWQS